jgi:hypothetical protein
MFTIPVAIVGACFISAALWFAALRRRKSAKAELGALSDQWIAEYRFGQRHDGHG